MSKKKSDQREENTKIFTVDVTDDIIMGGNPVSIVITGQGFDFSTQEIFILDSTNSNIDTTSVSFEFERENFLSNHITGIVVGHHSPITDKFQRRSLGIKRKDETLSAGACPADSSSCFILPDAIELKFA